MMEYGFAHFFNSSKEHIPFVVFPFTSFNFIFPAKMSVPVLLSLESDKNVPSNIIFSIFPFDFFNFPFIFGFFKTKSFMKFFAPVLSVSHSKSSLIF